MDIIIFLAYFLYIGLNTTLCEEKTHKITQNIVFWGVKSGLMVVTVSQKTIYDFSIKKTTECLTGKADLIISLVLFQSVQAK